MTKTKPLALFSAASVLFTIVGCASNASDLPQVEEIGDGTSALVVANGRELNGRELNGRELNGRELNGRELNGVSLDGVGIAFARTDGIRIGGTTLGRSELDGTWLEGRAGRGRKYKRLDFVGAELDGVLDNGATIPLRIDSIHPHGGPGGGDAHAYDVSFRTDAGWEPFCGTDATGAAVHAVPLAGRWDYRAGVAGGGAHHDDEGALSFACGNYILAKCVGFGYRPWDRKRGVELAAHHQACTRLMRADYCGDGTAHTVNGSAINLYDDLRIQRDTETWTFEAEWDAAGARCVNRNRQGPLPACALPLMTQNCGERGHFVSGTLLMSEAP